MGANMQFSEILSELLNGKGITPNALSKEIGVSSESVYNWINKGASPSLDKSSNIADYFNITLDELAGRVPPQHTEQEIELLNLFRNMDNKQKENLIHYAKFTLS